MGQCDLYVQWCSDAVRYHDEDEPVRGGGDTAVEHEVAEPVPEHHLSSDLEVAVPPCWSFGGALAEEEVRPGADVEVEAAEEEDGVVEPMLMRDGEARKGVEVHDLIVVGTSE